jgi:tyrosyl-tRNA synthetase
MNIDRALDEILLGAEFGDPSLGAAMRQELTDRLIHAERTGTPLRVYAGYDPTKPDIHLGHTITLRKLQVFQELGHHVIFLVGTFTALVGDTSDKLSGRPRLDDDAVRAAAATYTEQCFKILDRDRTEVVFNHEWLSPLTLSNVLNLADKFTVQQFLVRDNYKRRIEAGNPVGLHEFFYALLQGYDAVHLRADVQLGATEQLFNIMAGRKLQEAFGQKPCVLLSYPILVGTDGKQRMSKSTGNYVGINEPPSAQYGKTMSISDETMLNWLTYVTRWPRAEIEAKKAALSNGATHPMLLKKQLAWEVVAQYHGDAAADAAQQEFETIHQQREQPQELPEHAVALPVNVVELIVTLDFAASRSAARRLIDGHAVRIDDVEVDNYDQMVDAPCIVRVGKRHFARIIPA